MLIKNSVADIAFDNIQVIYHVPT